MQTDISNLILQYSELNRIYDDLAAGATLLFETQCYISDFYEKFKDLQSIDETLLHLACADDRQCNILLMRLRQEVNANIVLYEKYKECLDGLDIQKACDRYERRFDAEIEAQRKATRLIGKELSALNGSLEALGYREHSDSEEKKLTSLYEQTKQEYEKEYGKVCALFEQKTEAGKQTYLYHNNVCPLIYGLSRGILTILGKYVEHCKEQNDNILYFPLNILAAIHDACNGAQFEDIGDMDFCANMNLQPCCNKLIKRPGEKSRVCYLIHLLSEKLDAENRVKWRNEILKSLEIEAPFYWAKYRMPLWECPSENDKRFGDAMQQIFNRFEASSVSRQGTKKKRL